MVFAIGWSSVSIASVNVMQHEQMMNSSLLDEHQSMMKNSVVQEMKQHCADIQQKQNDQNSHLNHEQQLQNLKDCHNQQVQSQDTQQSKCPDCTAFSCQSSVVWFNPDIPKLIAPDHLHNTQAYQINTKLSTSQGIGKKSYVLQKLNLILDTFLFKVAC